MITLGEQLLPMFNTFLNWVILHMPEIQAFIDSAIKVAATVIQSLSNLINDVLIPKFQKIIDIVKQIAEIIFPNMGTSSSNLETTVKNLVTFGMDILITALAWVRDNMPLVKVAIMSVTAVWLIQKGVLLAHNITMAAHRLAQLASIVLNGTEASTTGMATLALLIHKGAVLAGTAAQWLFNGAMLANPIGIVVLALAGLGLAIYGVVKHWKDIVKWIQKAWNWLKKWNGEPSKDKNINVNTKYTSSGSSSQYGGVNRGYASGTDFATPGAHWVGEEGPEIVNFKGGETVTNATDSAKIASNTTKQPITLQLVLGNGKAVAEYLIDDINKLIGNENKVGSRGMGI